MLRNSSIRRKKSSRLNPVAGPSTILQTCTTSPRFLTFQVKDLLILRTFPLLTVCWYEHSDAAIYVLTLVSCDGISPNPLRPSSVME
jgi:hypothetical protein